MQNFTKALKLTMAPLMAATLIAGCSNTDKSVESQVGKLDKNTNGEDVATTGPVARFQPSASVLPSPTDILFSGSVDGSVNIPLRDAAGTALFNYNKATAPTAAQLSAAGANMPRVAINTLDGFSTTSPIVFTTSVAPDTASLAAGKAVRVFKVDTLPASAATQFNASACLLAEVCTGFDRATKTSWSLVEDSAELTYGIDFVINAADAATDGSVSVAIVPLKPLDPNSTYMVMVTKQLKQAADTSKAMSADLEYGIAKGDTAALALSRNLYEFYGGEAGVTAMAGALSAALAPLAVTKERLTALTTPGTGTSCVLSKAFADAIDANTPLRTALSLGKANLNMETDCSVSFAALSGGDTPIATAGTFERLRLQTTAQENALKNFSTVMADEVETSDMILTFSFSTQNVGSALLQAKAISAGAIASAVGAELAMAPDATPALTIDVPTGSPVDVVVPELDLDGDPEAGPFAPTRYAQVAIGTLNNVPHMIDPNDLNGSFWKGDPAAWQDLASLGGNAALKAACDAAFSADVKSENLVPCNGYKPVVAGSVSIPVLFTIPNVAVVNATRAAIATAAAGTPTTNDCPSPLPVTIYQHGITTNRATALAIANSMALQCQVVVAIDMPKHGIVDGDSAEDILAAAAEGTEEEKAAARAAAAQATVRDASPASERLVAGETSGQSFINPGNLVNSRDVFRQSVADLHALFAAIAPSKLSGMIPAGAYSNAKFGMPFDEDSVNFVGMSLGGIVGMPFIAQQADVKAAVLNVTGGGIGKLLDGSNAYGPRIAAGLAAKGITRPSAGFEAFILATQTLLDSADPINMTNQIVKPNSTGTTAGATARPILFQMIAGSNTELPDQVVPNNVFGLPTQEGGAGQAFAQIYSKGGAIAPATYNPANTVPGLLSGSDPMVRGTAFVGIAGALAKAKAENDAATLAALEPLAANPNAINTLDVSGNGLVDGPAGLAGAFLGMNLVQISEQAAPTPVSQALVRFNKGYHGSLLDPSSNADVTKAMQTQMAGFLGSAGAGVPGTAAGVPAGVIAAP